MVVETPNHWKIISRLQLFQIRFENYAFSLKWEYMCSGWTGEAPHRGVHNTKDQNGNLKSPDYHNQIKKHHYRVLKYLL